MLNVCHLTFLKGEFNEEYREVDFKLKGTQGVLKQSTKSFQRLPKRNAKIIDYIGCLELIKT